MPYVGPAAAADDADPRQVVGERPRPRGQVADVSLDDAVRVARDLATQEGILAGIRESLKFEDSTESELEKAYDSFLDQFETSDGQSIKAGKEEHVALEDEDVEQEQIVKQKRG